MDVGHKIGRIFAVLQANDAGKGAMQSRPINVSPFRRSVLSVINIMYCFKGRGYGSKSFNVGGPKIRIAAVCRSQKLDGPRPTAIAAQLLLELPPMFITSKLFRRPTDRGSPSRMQKARDITLLFCHHVRLAVYCRFDSACYVDTR